MKNNSNYYVLFVFAFTLLVPTAVLRAADTSGDQENEIREIIECISTYNIQEHQIELIPERIKEVLMQDERGMYVEGFAQEGLTPEGIPCWKINRYYLIPTKQKCPFCPNTNSSRQ